MYTFHHTNCTGRLAIRVSLDRCDGVSRVDTIFGRADGHKFPQDRSATDGWQTNARVAVQRSRPPSSHAGPCARPVGLELQVTCSGNDDRDPQERKVMGCAPKRWEKRRQESFSVTIERSVGMSCQSRPLAGRKKCMGRSRAQPSTPPKHANHASPAKILRKKRFNLRIYSKKRPKRRSVINKYITLQPSSFRSHAVRVRGECKLN
jgi:hypothetical protein